MAQIKLFGGLQRQVGTTVVTAPGESVEGVLQNAFISYPALKTAVFDNEQQLKPHIRVMLNGHHIEHHDGLATAVDDQDVIAIFPPIAGG